MFSFFSKNRFRNPLTLSIGIPDRQIAKEARSPDRKRSQIARSQKKPDRINTTFIVEFGPCQIGRNPPDRQAPDRSRSIKNPDRQIGTARSAPDHFRLASKKGRKVGNCSGPYRALENFTYLSIIVLELIIVF